MTYEEHLEVSYWAVMATLSPAEIPLSILEELRPRFLESRDRGARLAGRLLCDALSCIEWDWPMWHSFARRERLQTLADIDAMIDRMKPSAMLKNASNSELRTLCKESGVSAATSTVKLEMIKRLRKAIPEDALAEMARPFGERTRAQLKESCRDEMAMMIASRVGATAINALHYEQLMEPQFAALRSFWKFSYVEDFTGPRRCKRLDGKILPIDKALSTFPHLPCDYARCSCYISAVD